MVAVLERSSIIRVWGLFVYICDATACPRLFNATVARNACARVFVKHSNALYMQFEFSFSFPFIQVLQQVMMKFRQCYVATKSLSLYIDYRE